MDDPGFDVKGRPKIRGGGRRASLLDGTPSAAFPE